ncbi:MAG: hypothetical protein ACHP9Y_04655, partial [Gammaproteobacteria bacterium]
SLYKKGGEANTAVFWQSARTDPKNILGKLIEQLIECIDKFLATVDPVTGKSHAEMMLDQFFSLDIGNIAKYEVRMPALRETYLKNAFNYILVKSLPAHTDDLYSVKLDYLNTFYHQYSAAKGANPFTGWKSPYLQHMQEILQGRSPEFSQWWNAQVDILWKDSAGKPWDIQLQDFALSAAARFVQSDKFSNVPDFLSQHVPAGLFQPLVDKYKSETEKSIDRMLSQQAPKFSIWWKAKVSILLENFNETGSQDFSAWNKQLQDFALTAASEFITESNIPIDNAIFRQGIPPILFQSLVDVHLAATHQQLTTVDIVCRRGDWQYRPSQSIAENLQIYLSEPRFLYKSNDGTVTANTLDRVFEHLPIFMARYDLAAIFPVHHAAYVSFTKILEQWPNWFATFMQNAQDAPYSVKLTQANVDMLDPAQDFRNWWNTYGNEITDFLQTIDATTGKSVLDTLVETLLPAAGLEERMRYKELMQTQYIAGFLQSVNVYALTIYKQRFESLTRMSSLTSEQEAEIDTYQNKELYLQTLTTFLLRQPIVPSLLDQDESLSTPTSGSRRSSISDFSLPISSEGEGESESESISDGSSVESATTMPTLSQKSSESSVIKEIIDAWFLNKEAPQTDNILDRAVHEMVAFDNYLYEQKASGKFFLQEQLDRCYAKSEKIPLFRHYAKYEKNFYKQLLTAFLTKLCTTYGNEPATQTKLRKDLEKHHERLINGITSTEKNHRHEFIQALESLCKTAEQDPTLHRIDKRYPALQHLKGLVLNNLIEFFSSKARHASAEYDAFRQVTLEHVEAEAARILSTQPTQKVSIQLVKSFQEYKHRLTQTFGEAKKQEKAVHMVETTDTHLASQCEQFKQDLTTLLDSAPKRLAIG